MNTRLAIFALAFLLVLTTLTAGYFVVKASAPGGSAAGGSAVAVTPQTRQIAVLLTTYEDDQGKMYRRWLPDLVAANAGDTLIFRVTNTDKKSAHGFALASLGVEVKVDPGKTETVKVVARTPGIHTFACTVDKCAEDHADQMGQLVVLGAAR
ncbi:MAG: cupredoxin domain-containing protein [Armatimonadetes bacterium]|nr:cupredoxin domain-containing protein [Armatimonadota bacterium]